MNAATRKKSRDLPKRGIFVFATGEPNYLKGGHGDRRFMVIDTRAK